RAPPAAVAFVAPPRTGEPDVCAASGARAPTRQAHRQSLQTPLGDRQARRQALEALAPWLLERALEHDKPPLLSALLRPALPTAARAWRLSRAHPAPKRARGRRRRAALLSSSPASPRPWPMSPRRASRGAIAVWRRPRRVPDRTERPYARPWPTPRTTRAPWFAPGRVPAALPPGARPTAAAPSPNACRPPSAAVPPRHPTALGAPGTRTRARAARRALARCGRVPRPPATPCP